MSEYAGCAGTVGTPGPPSQAPPFLLQGEGSGDPSVWSLWERIHAYYWISQSPPSLPPPGTA